MARCAACPASVDFVKIRGQETAKEAALLAAADAVDPSHGVEAIDRGGWVGSAAAGRDHDGFIWTV